MQCFDLLIIGNGVIGLSIALNYIKKQPKARVGVVGPASRTGSATQASGAMLGCFSEVTQANLSCPHYQTLLDSAAQASKRWPDFLKEINTGLEQKQTPASIQPGTFIILNTETGDYEADNYHAIMEALRRYAIPFESVDPRTIPGLSPVSRCRPLSALHLPEEGCISSQALLTALTQTLRQKGVIFLEDKVVGATASSQKLHALITEKSERLSARHVVLAAGAYSQELINQFPDVASRIPRILAGHGTALLLDNTENKIPVKSVIRSPNRSGACGIHLLPWDANADTLYLGASNSLMLSPKTAAKMRDVHYLSKRAIEQLNHNFHKTSLIKTLVGNRPVPLDTLPLIGKTSIDNLWLATGTYRIGVELAPVIADFIINDLLGQNTQDQEALRRFSPERPLIERFNQAQSKKAFVEQYISAGYEHALSLPKVGWETMLQDTFEHRVGVIYDRLETNIGLHPDVLIMLELNPSYVPLVKQYIQQNQTAYAKKEEVVL